MALALGNLVDEAAGVAMRLARKPRGQQLHAGAEGRHDVTASQRIGVVHQQAIERAALGYLGVALKRLVCRPPLILEQRRVVLIPLDVVRPQADPAPERHRVIHGVPDGLMRVGVHAEKAGFQGIDQRDVQTILPDAGQAIGRHAMFVPAAIGRDDEVVGAQRQLVAVDDGVRPAPLHDEAQRRGRVPVRRCRLARVHHLQPRIQPPHRSGHIAPAGVV